MRSTIFNDRPKKKVRLTHHPQMAQMVNVYKYGLGFTWICTFAQHRRAQVLIVAQPGFPNATMQQDAKQLTVSWYVLEPDCGAKLGCVHGTGSPRIPYLVI